MKRVLSIPNMLSISRIIFLPLLYLFLWNSRINTFFLSFSLLGSTDFLDGYLARKWKQVTNLGKKLDTVADMFFYISVAYFLYWLSPEAIINNTPLLVMAFSVYGVSFLVPFIKFGTPYTLHTRILRSNAVIVYIMMLLAAFMNTTVLLGFVLIVFIVGFIEQICIFLRFGQVDQDTTSYWALSFEKKLHSFFQESSLYRLRNHF